LLRIVRNGDACDKQEDRAQSCAHVIAQPVRVRLLGSANLDSSVHARSRRPKAQAVYEAEGALVMAQRKMSKKKREYLNYLRTTIIPDTKASGGVYTARDLQKCARLIKAGKTDAKFVRFLRGTLIPDLKASGSEGYVEDFTQCARYIAPKRHRR
jgi:hypothetical protein